MMKVNGTTRANIRGHSSTASDVTICVLIPGGGAPKFDTNSMTGVLERSIRRLAAKFLGTVPEDEQVRLVAYDAVSQLVETIPGPATQAAYPAGPQEVSAYLRRFRDVDPLQAGRIIIFASVSFMLRSWTLSAGLLDRCVWFGACCVGQRGGDLYAVAFASGAVEQRLGLASGLLRRIASQCRTSPDGEGGYHSDMGWDRVDASGAAHSPAMRGYGAGSTAPHFDAPSFLNAAIAEAFHHPADSAPVASDPVRLKQALAAQRDQSATPWLFNELLNEVEYRTAETNPISIPPEIHIAVSNLCNIECNFCSYSHEVARRDRVSPEQFMKLNFLRYARVLRLHSGNGESTTNPALATLIGFVEKAYPQISMDFFTNGILLDRPGLIPALVGGHVGWINVSLNAASRQGWLELCGSDHFDRICKNVNLIYEEKIRRKAIDPVVYGSMVLTRKSVWELPQMPELCNRLGVDRFTAIPFFSLGYDAANRLSSADAYHHINKEYDEIYDATVAEARKYSISLELPGRRGESVAKFGVERRDFHDFANIKPHEGRLKALLDGFDFPVMDSPCHFLWRQAAIGATTRHQGGTDTTHFLYPCLGPLAALDMAAQTAFHFPDEAGFADLWRNPLFTRLRRGQTEPGLVEVCDACRGCDSRAPENMASMSDLLERFARENGLVPGALA